MPFKVDSAEFAAIMQAFKATPAGNPGWQEMGKVIAASYLSQANMHEKMMQDLFGGAPVPAKPKFAVGDRVAILVELAGVRRKSSTGVITAIDGAYIFVRPHWKKWTVELYPNEILKIDK